MKPYVHLLMGVAAFFGLSVFTNDLRTSSPTETTKRKGVFVLPGGPRIVQNEDRCSHCKGTGLCDFCAPFYCRVCYGSGVINDSNSREILAEIWKRDNSEVRGR